MFVLQIFCRAGVLSVSRQRLQARIQVLTGPHHHNFIPTMFTDESGKLIQSVVC